MGSPTLPHLPTETLTFIFGYFCLHCCEDDRPPWGLGTLQQHERRLEQQRGEQQPEQHSWHSLDRRPLVSLCLVSKRLRDVAQPILHHEFRPGYSDSWRSKLLKWDGRLTSFMRTMTQRSDLARSVKVVSIQTCLFFSLKLEEARDTLLECADALRIDLLEAWKPRNTKRRNEGWIALVPRFFTSFLDRNTKISARTRRLLANSFHNRHSTGLQVISIELVAMLIAQLPNLEHLSIRNPFAYGGDFRPFLKESLPALNVSSLSSLKTLDISVFTPPILELATNLEVLNIQRCSIPSPVPPMPNLKVVRITNRSLSEKHLQNLLSSCTGKLRVFVYEAFVDTLDPSKSHRGSGDHFRLGGAVTYLYPHRHSLQSLHLDLRAEDVFQSYAIGGVRPETGLKHFTALEKLLLSTNAIPYPSGQMFPSLELLGELLPSSIVSLHVVHEDGFYNKWENVEKGLIKLTTQLRLYQKDFPNMRWVGYEHEGSSNGDTVSSMFGVDAGPESWPRSEYADEAMATFADYEAEMFISLGGQPLPVELSDDDL
ncbi:hypothetical protein B0J13DRAFT_74729 [Dactylonectria estremocensis]|uniref:Uncharacterized protein n=1 Tax=Dactylonectria estremocensis TaxID=1079267 RepID=A0A9P9IXD4_9HYPO|nr:hypothetical protein B0J13DRAFT_74729 [Dactylonectria estremocensis]